jgi:hypothetical protein
LAKGGWGDLKAIFCINKLKNRFLTLPLSPELGGEGGVRGILPHSTVSKKNVSRFSSD